MPLMSRRAPWLPFQKGIALFMLLAALSVGMVYLSSKSKQSPLLFPSHGAQWIKEDLPFELNGQEFRERVTIFGTKFTVQESTPQASVEVEAQEGFAAFVDGKPLKTCVPQPGVRHQKATFQLPPEFTGGKHELVVYVESIQTHPMLRVRAPGLGIHTDRTWSVMGTSKRWRPAVLATDTKVPAISMAFPTAFGGTALVWPWLALAFGLGATASVVRDWKGSWFPRVTYLRWGILVLWVVLSANNLTKIPGYVGRDVPGHLDYIRYLVSLHRIPTAAEGMQMFQPPLAYLLYSPFYALMGGIPDESKMMLLRFLPMLCGLLQLEVCFRTARVLYPQREGLQVAGMVLGGLLPINIYMSQAIGNEPVAGLLCSLALFWVIKRWVTGRSMVTPRFALGFGGLLGLTLLAKVTSILLVPALCGFCILAYGDSTPPTRSDWLRFLLLFAAGVVATSGWYYLWIWSRLGHLFVGGWEASRGIAFWQDPGYVTLSSVFRFGMSLYRPIYASSAGFMDGLYSTFWLDGCLGSCFRLPFHPPWNYGFITASALTGLLPCGVMVRGVIKRWSHPPVALSWICILTLVLGILRLYLTEIPSYATLKASYLMGLLPCFAILGVAGLDGMSSTPWSRALVAGCLCLWATSVYVGYFVV